MVGLKAGHQADVGLSPVERFGVKVASIGFVLKPGLAVIWRGPMIGSGVRQLLHDLPWAEDGDLDYLVIDLPPGTSDALRPGQEAPIAGAVIAPRRRPCSEDATKAVMMFEKLNVPVFGVIENMSYFLCPHCGERTDVFGHGGAREAADELGLDFLGEIPLDATVRESGDQGVPIVERDPDSPVAKEFMTISERIAAGPASALLRRAAVVKNPPCLREGPSVVGRALLFFCALLKRAVVARTSTCPDARGISFRQLAVARPSLGSTLTGCRQRRRRPPITLLRAQTMVFHRYCAAIASGWGQ
jgi:hypothetical protein